jgi:hypothetical protein
MWKKLFFSQLNAPHYSLSIRKMKSRILRETWSSTTPLSLNWSCSDSEQTEMGKREREGRTDWKKNGKIDLQLSLRVTNRVNREKEDFIVNGNILRSRTLSVANGESKRARRNERACWNGDFVRWVTHVDGTTAVQGDSCDDAWTAVRHPPSSAHTPTLPSHFPLCLSHTQSRSSEACSLCVCVHCFVADV